MSDIVKLDISWQSLWRIAVFVVIALLVFFARQAVGVFLISVVVSLGLDKIVTFLESKKIHRLLGTLFIFLLGLILVAVTVYAVVPVLVREMGGFLGHFNKALATFLGFGLPETLIQDVNLTLDNALNFLSAANVSVTGAIGAVFGKIILVFSTVIISFYLTVDKGGTERLLRVILPHAYERRVLVVFHRFEEKIHSWFIAQLGLSIIVGVLVSVGLWLLGVRYALVLGLLAAVFEVVPVIGPIVIGLIAFLVAATDSIALGLYTLLFFFIVQQIENHVLIPLVMGRMMKVHPVIVVVSLVAGAEIAGFVGIVLAVPVAVIAQEIFNYIVEEKERRSALQL